MASNYESHVFSNVDQMINKFVISESLNLIDDSYCYFIWREKYFNIFDENNEIPRLASNSVNFFQYSITTYKDREALYLCSCKS